MSPSQAAVLEDSVFAALCTFAEQSQSQGRPVHLPEGYEASFPLAESGIDSILLADMAVSLEEAFSVELNFAELYRVSTLGELVALVSSGEAR